MATIAPVASPNHMSWKKTLPPNNPAPNINPAYRTAELEYALNKVGCKALVTAPKDFHLHKTIARLLEAKAKMFETGEGFDWATCEALAFGTLLNEGFYVRLSGQDSQRGTFSLVQDAEANGL